MFLPLSKIRIKSHFSWFRVLPAYSSNLTQTCVLSNIYLLRNRFAKLNLNFVNDFDGIKSLELGPSYSTPWTSHVITSLFNQLKEHPYIPI